jgi:hypothetical protein
MSKRIVVGFLGVWILICAPRAQAQNFPLPPTDRQAQDFRLPPTEGEVGEGIELTPWLHVKPFLRHTTFYTTNVDQAPGRRKDDDFTFATIMGTYLRAADEDNERWLSIGYAATSLLFAENGRYDTWEHRALYDFQITAGKFTINSRGTATWRATNADPQFAGRNRNFMGTAHAGIDWDPTDTFGLRLDGDVSQVHNFPRQLHPINNYGWRGGAFAVIRPNVDFDLEFELGGHLRGYDYYDRLAFNPDIDAGGVVAGVRVGSEIVTLQARGGVEFPWASSRRTLPRRGFGSRIPHPFYGNMSLILEPVRSTKFTFSASHRLNYTGFAFWQRLTTFRGTIEQQIPVVEGLRLFASAEYNHQDNRHSTTLRTQSYAGGAGWEIVEYVEIGAQATYIRSSSRNGDFETFTAGGTITLKL